MPQVSELAAVVLAAGAGTRLRPLTWLRPKALCPVENVPLVDLAVGWARTVTGAVAVNIHHGRAALESHLVGRVHLSIEEPHVYAECEAAAKPERYALSRSFSQPTIVLAISSGCCPGVRPMWWPSG